ncbi:MAG: CHAT domain-containing protein [Candidatus Omnitrophota bacterium]|jgi:tetratricopeptide (TPR) repeat protein/CHAT domain-containing protein
MPDSNSLVLEIFQQDKGLRMSVYERKELISTLRHYNYCNVPFTDIDKLREDIIFILNKADNSGNLSRDLFDKLKRDGQLLWNYLLSKPVKDKLKSAFHQNLILSIDEELIGIPWELLHDGNEFLCLKFSLGRLVRTGEETLRPQYRSPASVLKMLILANPTNDLAGAYSEGINIRNQFDRKRNDIRIDFKSTYIDRMYIKKSIGDYDIVHYAGHCEFDPNDPKKSGWVLTDGKFDSEDILNLSSSVTLPSLLFSNACYSAKSSVKASGIDDHKKTYSIVSAFLFSGVRHYVGSTQKLEDSASLFFAKEFYGQLIGGATVGESLRLARVKLIECQGPTSIHWSSYLLYGDPNFSLFNKATFKQPPPAVKKSVFRNIKFIRLLATVTGIFLVSLFLYLWLPSLNPSVYFMYAKSQKLFLKGENRGVINLTQSIIERDPNFLSAYPLLADTYQRIGDRDNALRYYFEYILYSERKKDKVNLASAYIGIGWVYYLQGDYNKAFDYYNKGLVLARENKDKSNEADVMGKMAVWYMDKKNYDLALELLTKSSEINRSRRHIYRHKYNLACDYFNIGLLFADKGDYAAAREFYDKSFKLFESMKMRHELSDYYFNIGEIYAFQKEYLKALECYHKGLKIDQSLGHKPNIAGDYNMIGELYAEMDDRLKAQDYFNLAAQVANEINFRPETASAHYNLGILYKNWGKKNRARENFRIAEEIYSSIDPQKYREIQQELLNLSN